MASRTWSIHFKKKEGRWVPLSRPPVRFDDEHAYSDLGEWLYLSIERILSTLGSACAIEVFSSLYATINPWEALEHAAIFTALERLCHVSRHRRGIRQFSLAAVSTEMDPRCRTSC
jgi:hypothetical protein